MLADRDLGTIETIETIEEHQRPERGPLRPRQLLSTRKRRARRLAAHWFRAGDTVLIVVALTWFVHGSSSGGLFQASLAEVGPVGVGGWSAWRLLGLLDLYRFPRGRSLMSQVLRVGLAVLTAAPATLSTQLVVPDDRLPATTVVQFFALLAAAVMAAHVAWWILVARWRTQGWLTPNLVVVGATAHAAELIDEAIGGRHDVNILGVFDDRIDRSPLAILGVPVLGDTEALLNHHVMPFVDLVVVAIDASGASRVRDITARLALLPNQVTLLVDDPVSGQRSVAIEQLGESPLAPLRSHADAERRAYAKRFQDIAIASVALCAAAPLMALIALAVRLDSGGPVFFRQRRHGFNNEEIVVWKFRTMRHEAADARAERQVTADDDRVTRVGGWLRRTSLDELPQLLNVVAGDMSLVGPRPHAIGMKTGEIESARLVAEYAHRHRIKPGMTGWAAIHGSRGPLHEPSEVLRRVALDVEYIERQTFWLDLRIVAQTIPAMLGDRRGIR